MQTNPAVEQNKYLLYDIFANLMDRVTGRRDESVTFASLHEEKDSIQRVPVVTWPQ